MSTSASLEVQVATSAEAIGAEAWNCLGRERPFGSYRWYRFGEATLASDVPFYAVVSSGGRPVARGTFWLTRNPALPIASRAARGLLGVLFRNRPLLICRTPLTDLSGLILPDWPLRQEALGLILQAAKTWAREQRASFVVFDYLDQAEAAGAGWPRDAGTSVVQEPSTQLDLGWPDFEGYLKSLRASARKSYRQNCAHAAEIGVQVRVLPKVPDQSSALTLIGNVERRFGSATPWAASMIENMGMAGGAWLAAERDGKLAAGCMLLQDGAAGMLTLLGRDYAVPHAYFQLFYRGIRWAIEAGVRRLRGGSGAYDLKRRLGFQVHANNHAVFMSEGRLFGKLAQWMAPL